jgi:hypothetical protein
MEARQSFYVWDPDSGAAFIETNAYAPWPIWLWLNGHDWATPLTRNAPSEMTIKGVARRTACGVTGS